MSYRSDKSFVLLFLLKSVHFGVLSVCDFNDFFALQSVLLYAEKGYKVKEGVLDEGKIKSVKARFHFVSLPVLLEYKPFPFMALELGPSFGFQVGRELFFDNVLQSDTRFGIKRIFNVDGIVGCKFIYRQIYIEGQYYKSFSSLYRKVDDFKLRGFSVSLGYNFKLK